MLTLERAKLCIILATSEGGDLRGVRAHVSCTFPPGPTRAQIVQLHASSRKLDTLVYSTLPCPLEFVHVMCQFLPNAPRNLLDGGHALLPRLVAHQ